MKLIKTTEAEGFIICHDMTQICSEEKKGVRFFKGHQIQKEDIPVLLSMGKEHIYVWEEDPSCYHENEAAHVLKEVCVGKNIYTSEPKEGKIDFISKIQGVLWVNIEKLNQINNLEGVIVSTKASHIRVMEGEKIGATKIVPLFIKKDYLNQITDPYFSEKAIVEVLPFVRNRVGLIITGNEIKAKRIEDRFTPLLQKKLEEYGYQMQAVVYPGDDSEEIAKEILRQKEAGIQLIICTGGMSVDPDDRTPNAIKLSGATIVSYGAPVLPGAMFLLSYLEETVVIGMPAGVAVSKESVFDKVLPRITANIKLNRGDITSMGHGGYLS